MSQQRIRVGIIGGAGYTGGETIRLLVNHPEVELIFVHSRSNAGQSVSRVHKDLVGDTSLVFTDKFRQDVDVLFLCLGHGESQKFLAETQIESTIKIIDLSQDFRLGQQSGVRKFIYGLPELNKAVIVSASNVANPGCFATTIELGLLPLAKAGQLDEVFCTGITGSTGAGQKLQDTTHFTWRSSNISAYKTLAHQHLAEITRSIKQLQPGFGKAINFVPWRGDFTRGIFVSSVVTSDLSLPQAKSLYEDFYHDAAFTHVVDDMVDLKQVVNTNKCLIHLEKEGDKLVVHSVADNLLKGASGQAVQNMNLMFGLPEKSGLQLKSTVF
ncbi:MAG: N-acetyl-gamma-glutamyl-phosphate reductase [Cyclobacteriaceae bacterium]